MELRAKEVNLNTKVFVLSVTDIGDVLVDHNNIVASSDEILMNTYLSIFQNIVSNLINSPESLKDIIIDVTIGNNKVSISKDNIDKISFNITELKNV